MSQISLTIVFAVVTGEDLFRPLPLLLPSVFCLLFPCDPFSVLFSVSSSLLRDVLCQCSSMYMLCGSFSCGLGECERGVSSFSLSSPLASLIGVSPVF